MEEKRELAHKLYEIYRATGSKDEFLHVMKSKTDLYSGDLDLLWFIINVSYSAGFDDNYDV